MSECRVELPRWAVPGQLGARASGSLSARVRLWHGASSTAVHGFGEELFRYPSAECEVQPRARWPRREHCRVEGVAPQGQARERVPLGEPEGKL